LREIHLDELLTYGFCPQKWLYQYGWRAPYLEVDSQEAFFRAYRRAVGYIVNAMVRGTGVVTARNRAGEILWHDMLRTVEQGTISPKVARELLRDSGLGLLAFLEMFFNPRGRQVDRVHKPLGGSVPAAVADRKGRNVVQTFRLERLESPMRPILACEVANLG